MYLSVCVWEDDKYYIISLQSSKGAEKHNIHLLKKDKVKLLIKINRS